MDETLTKLIDRLTEARSLAIAAKLDYHFVSELDGLVATAKANLKDGGEV